MYDNKHARIIIVLIRYDNYTTKILNNNTIYNDNMFFSSYLSGGRDLSRPEARPRTRYYTIVYT